MVPEQDNADGGPPLGGARRGMVRSGNGLLI